MNTNIILNTQLTDYDYTDKRRKNAIVLDVETALSEGNEQLIFDIGWTVTNVSKRENVMHRSYVVQEIFLDMKLMERAYYFNKYPQYVQALAKGTTTMLPFNEIIKILNADIKEYNVYRMFAYNANFDKTAINKTHRYLNNETSELLYEMKDLWSLATQTFMATEKFILTALENGWTTEKGNIKTSAEIAYRYLTGKYEFIEKHTATEDTIIETELLWKINGYSEKDFECSRQPWRRIADLKKELDL